MVQNDPRAKANAIMKRENRKKYFSGSFRCFCPFLVVVGPFSGVQNRKNFEIFFSGFDLEWSETHFKPKISRKYPPSKVLRLQLRNFRASLRDPKPVKPNILKNYRFKIFQGVVHYSLR